MDAEVLSGLEADDPQERADHHSRALGMGRALEILRDFIPGL
jgi:hypothetical protein